jgi:hypothetical protein
LLDKISITEYPLIHNLSFTAFSASKNHKPAALSATRKKGAFYQPYQRNLAKGIFNAYIERCE